ncbi:MAG: hypothetical protein U5L96_17115 [Owenweeksia sp.]|nr:hypothetical protein [Owenweeksia sp.]
MKVSSIALGLLLLGVSSAMGQVPERFSKQGKNQPDSLRAKPAGKWFNHNPPKVKNPVD